MKVIYLSIAILGGVGFLVLQLFRDQTTMMPPAHTQHLEWFGQDITLIEINEQGQLKQTLQAQALQHYMPDNVTDLSQVYLHILPTATEQSDWHLTSDKGRLFHGEDKKDISRIDLWHNVQLLKPQSETESEVKINTSTLAVFPEQEYAHTDQYTIINQIGQQMSGDGMNVFFPTEEFYLLKNVSSIHENAS